MVKLDRLAKVIIRINLFVIAALSATLITPFSLNIHPLNYVRLTFSLLIFCGILLVFTAPKRSKSELNHQGIKRLFTGLMASGTSFIFSLIVLPFMPPFSPTLIFLFPLFLVHPVSLGKFIYSDSTAYNSTRFIISPSGQKSIKLVCFSIGFLDRETGGYLYKEWFLIQQKIAQPELADNADSCPTDESQKFTWSDNENYLNWQEYNRGDNSTVKKSVRVY